MIPIFMTHNKHGKGSPLDDSIQQFIGRKLKTTYEEVVNEDVPNHLLALLDGFDDDTKDETPEGAQPNSNTSLS